VEIRLRDFLAKAERAVDDSQSRVDRQRYLIETLDHRGADSIIARQILRALEGSRDVFCAHRDRLKQMLEPAAESRRESAAAQGGGKRRLQASNVSTFAPAVKSSQRLVPRNPSASDSGVVISTGSVLVEKNRLD
jgi:hypothetical protein